MHNLIARNAVITGASRGLGQAIAYKLASLGCSVTLISKNRKRLQDSFDNLPIIGHYQKHQMIDFDLEEFGAGKGKQENYEELIQILGNTSILVNCAGATSHRLLTRMKEEEITSLINLNLVAPILLSKLSCVPMMRIKKNALNLSDFVPVIVNISSILSITDHTLPGTSVYAATKAGLLGFTKSLASELRGKVRVNSIMPGLIQETDMGSLVNVNELKSVPIETVVDKTIESILDNSLNGECIKAENV